MSVEFCVGHKVSQGASLVLQRTHRDDTALHTTHRRHSPDTRHTSTFAVRSPALRAPKTNQNKQAVCLRIDANRRPPAPHPHPALRCALAARVPSRLAGLLSDPPRASVRKRALAAIRRLPRGRHMRGSIVVES